MFVVLFGIPGAGKTFVGRTLQDEFGFRFHDADHELPDNMRAALAMKQPVTDDMRNRFFEKVTQKVSELRSAGCPVAIAQTFLKDRYRRAMLATFPDTLFILVESRPELIVERFDRRADYLIDVNDALQMAARFEPPTIPHHIVQNDGTRGDVVAQLSVLFAEIAREAPAP